MANDKNTPTVGERKKGNRRRKEWMFCYLMLIPAMYAIFKYIYVNLDSILVAFTIRDAQGNQVASFNNFVLLFQQLGDPDGILNIAFWNTMKYFALLILKTFLAYGIAYFLYKKILGYRFFRTVFFLPSIISPIILVAIFKNIIEVYGPLWTLWKALFGVELPDFLGRPETATNVILIYTFWIGFGNSFLIFVGTMNRIPDDVIEAGVLDGVNGWQEFWRIIVPLGWETLSTLLLISLTQIFMSTGPILYFNGGQHNTTTLAYWIFDQVRFGSYNYPAAVGLFFTILAIPIVFGCRWLMNRTNANISY